MTLIFLLEGTLLCCFRLFVVSKLESELESCSATLSLSSNSSGSYLTGTAFACSLVMKRCSSSVLLLLESSSSMINSLFTF